MKILHYSLGFPPYRTGGLTKFCMDLMREQIKDGHNVGLLWPGEMKLIDRRVNIRKRALVDEISNYEIINPLPISFDEGIKEFDIFTQEGDKQIYDRFLSVVKPDIIHVHTLMGLHKNFIIAAKEKGIRLVFTTHDFFPICPKVTMFRRGQICNSVNSCEECGICNNTALSLKKIQILQSPIYRRFKNSSLVKDLRMRHRNKFLTETDNESSESVGEAKNYRSLRKYYAAMLEMMDMIHYNSSVTKEIYESVFYLPKNRIINISHSNISDLKRIKKFDSNVIRIRYLGAQSAAKGYNALICVLDEVWKERKDFILDVHFTPRYIPAYMKCHDGYSYNQLKDIFDNTDVLLCPSVWYETFGYTVLEALSFGVPVIISNHVGAKDILAEGCGITFNASDFETLKNIILKISQKDLKEMNKAILIKQKILTVDEMSSEIYKIYACCK